MGRVEEMVAEGVSIGALREGSGRGLQAMSSVKLG